MVSCNVCHTELNEDYLCPYCGYDGAVLTIDADYSKNYKEGVLKKIQNISIQAHKYVWNGKNGSFDAIETIELFDPKLSGKDYYCNTVYSKQKIHQVGIGMEQTIEINYSFAGSPKTAIVKLTPVQSSEPWSMSLEIDKNLRLNVMLGALCDNEDEVPPPPDRHVWAVVDLDLHA